MEKPVPFKYKLCGQFIDYKISLLKRRKIYCLRNKVDENSTSKHMRCPSFAYIVTENIDTDIV